MNKTWLFIIACAIPSIGIIVIIWKNWVAIHKRLLWVRCSMHMASLFFQLAFWMTFISACSAGACFLSLKLLSLFGVDVWEFYSLPSLLSILSLTIGASVLGLVCVKRTLQQASENIVADIEKEGLELTGGSVDFADKLDPSDIPRLVLFRKGKKVFLPRVGLRSFPKQTLEQVTAIIDQLRKQRISDINAEGNDEDSFMLSVETIDEELTEIQKHILKVIAESSIDTSEAPTPEERAMAVTMINLQTAVAYASKAYAESAFQDPLRLIDRLKIHTCFILPKKVKGEALFVLWDPSESEGGVFFFTHELAKKQSYILVPLISKAMYYSKKREFALSICFTTQRLKWMEENGYALTFRESVAKFFLKFAGRASRKMVRTLNKLSNYACLDYYEQNTPEVLEQYHAEQVNSIIDLLSAQKGQTTDNRIHNFFEVVLQSMESDGKFNFSQLSPWMKDLSLYKLTDISPRKNEEPASQSLPAAYNEGGEITSDDFSSEPEQQMSISNNPSKSRRSRGTKGIIDGLNSILNPSIHKHLADQKT